MRLRLTARGTRAVRRALRRHRSLRVAVRVQALDATGNVRTLVPRRAGARLMRSAGLALLLVLALAGRLRPRRR